MKLSKGLKTKSLELMLHCFLTQYYQVPSLDVAVPMHLKGLRARHNSLTEESENLNFVVMLKKGNKQQYKGDQSLVNNPSSKLNYRVISLVREIVTILLVSVRY